MKTEQKKEYKAPQMRSVELKHQANLMGTSGGGDLSASSFSGPMG